MIYFLLARGKRKANEDGLASMLRQVRSEKHEMLFPMFSKGQKLH